MHIRSRHIAIATLVCSGWPAWALEGSGLSPSGGGWFDGEWQARVELTSTLSGRYGADPYSLAADTSAQPLRSAGIFGDFYFRSAQGQHRVRSGLSGFRATSGLMIRPQGNSGSAYADAVGLSKAGRPFGSSGGFGVLPDEHGDVSPVPYLGLGYTEMPVTTGWGFRADMGLMALSPRSAVRLGGVLGGAQGVDDLVRDLRLSPLIQLGVSYSF